MNTDYTELVARLKNFPWSIAGISAKNKIASEAADAIESLLKGVPGWQLVPIEPTEEICNAGRGMVHPRIMAELYKAMLSASPKTEFAHVAEPLAESTAPSVDAVRFRKVVSKIGLYAGWWQVQIPHNKKNLFTDEELEAEFIKAIDEVQP